MILYKLSNLISLLIIRRYRNQKRKRFRLVIQVVLFLITIVIKNLERMRLLQSRSVFYLCLYLCYYGSDSDIEFIFNKVPPEIVAADKKRKGRSPVDIDDYDSNDEKMYMQHMISCWYPFPAPLQ
jgi:hypothetical protein